MDNQKIIVTLLLLTVSLAYCQNIKQKGDTYVQANPTLKFSLASSYVKDRVFNMHVTFAMDSVKKGKKYPVLLYTDGYGSVDLFNVSAGLLGAGKEIEPVILIGISFDAEPGTRWKLRNEDFLPDLENPNHVNGARNFLNFIKLELIPYVEKNFPVDSMDRGLFGYSYGALFATWVMMEEPTLFKRFGIASPSLWYKEFTLLKSEKLKEAIRAASDLKIFVEYGSFEVDEQKSGADKLYELIAGNKHIQSTKVILHGTHLSALPAACAAGLVYLYQKEN